MKPHVHAELIKQWADGEFKIERQTNSGNWIPCPFPTWIAEVNYRIEDPYAELKAAAADPTKQIRLLHVKGPGQHSKWEDAGYHWEWLWEPEEYEIRDKPPKTKMWQWIYRGRNGNVYMTNTFTSEPPELNYSLKVIQRADWTEIEVDQP